MLTKQDVSIVIPYLDRWHLTHARLMELYTHCRECEVVLVNDGSQDEDCFSGPKWWKDNTSLRIRYAHNPENLGFSKSNNRGAKKATGKVLILTQNDVVMSGDFVTPILKILNEREKIIIAGEVILDGYWNTFEVDGKQVIVPYAVGWMLAMLLETWQDLEGFDERYSPMDYEDVDFSAKAIYNGYELVPLNSPHLRHLFGKTTTDSLGEAERRKITMRNREKFIDKWRARILELGNAG